MVATTKTFVSAAKAANVTLTSPGARHALPARRGAELQQYVDSAWLRYDLPATSPNTRSSVAACVLVERFGLDEDPQLLASVHRRGWLVVEATARRSVRPRRRVLGALRNLGQRPQMPSVVPVKTWFSRWVRPGRSGNVTQRTSTPIVSGADAPLVLTLSNTRVPARTSAVIVATALSHQRQDLTEMQKNFRPHLPASQRSTRSASP